MTSFASERPPSKLIRFTFGYAQQTSLPALLRKGGATNAPRSIGLILRCVPQLRVRPPRLLQLLENPPHNCANAEGPGALAPRSFAAGGGGACRWTTAARLNAGVPWQRPSSIPEVTPHVFPPHPPLPPRAHGHASSGPSLRPMRAAAGAVHSWNTRNAPRRLALLAGFVIVGACPKACTKYGFATKQAARQPLKRARARPMSA